MRCWGYNHCVRCWGYNDGSGCSNYRSVPGGDPVDGARSRSDRVERHTQHSDGCQDAEPASKYMISWRGLFASVPLKITPEKILEIPRCLLIKS